MGEIVPAQEPIDLVAMALSQGAGPEQVTQLIELVKFHDSREAVKAYNAAFTAAQAEFPAIARTATAHNSRYAPYHKIVEEVRPVLDEYGLSFHHEIVRDPTTGSLAVSAVIAHRGGHEQRATLVADPDTSGNKNDIQALGSSVTYLKRYTLEAALGIVTTDDDTDANAQAQAISEEQIQDIVGRLEQLPKSTQDAFIRWLDRRGVKELSAIPQKMFGEVINNLNRKLQPKQAAQ